MIGSRPGVVFVNAPRIADHNPAGLAHAPETARDFLRQLPDPAQRRILSILEDAGAVQDADGDHLHIPTRD
jgi:hypothetical protein